MNMIDVLHMPRSIWLGRKTEQNFRPIAFDVYKWLTDYPEATVSIVYTRPDGQVFPVASSDRSPIIWIPQQDVTTVSGEGEIELHLVGGGAVGISASTKTLIDDSAASAQPTAPSWVDQVVQDVTEQADRAEEAADSIEGSITEKVNEVVPDAVADYMEDHPVTVEETDPTVPAWAKQPTKPTYTAQEVGALPSSYTPPVTSVNGMTGDVVVETGGGAVDSVNGKTGVVVLDASDVGALPAGTPIPAAVTEQTVAGWGFTKNTGTYSKPSGGIPATDLAQAVQTILNNAVLYSSQARTDAEKEQARANIGAASRSDLGTVFTLKGGVATVNDLPQTGNRVGDVWYVENVSAGFIWITSTAYPNGYWEELGETVDLSAYAEKTWVEGKGYQTAQDVQTAIAAIPDELPAVTASDNGKFLRVANGAWAAQSVPSAESNSFGGA